MNPKLGRLPAPDPRDRQHRFAAELPAVPSRPYRYWTSGWFGDQGNTSSCVGYAWTHWLTSTPVTQQPRNWTAYAADTYRTAQTLDEWPGEDYDGTSVRAGAKALQQFGFISEYRWAWTAAEIVRAVIDVGPVVVGTAWTDDMFNPVRGYVTPTGTIAGGHAYLIDGANTNRRVVRLKNSWGRDWSIRGRAWMTFDDLDWLMQRDGEAALATELRI